MRKSGTTVIIEDVAFPVPKLAEATLDLQELLKKYSYHEAVIFGHALEGNLHFVFSQDFSTKEELKRYENLISDLSKLVVDKYDGALKAEHGTGRNMAPFLELEWGEEAFELMKQIKQVFDPEYLLNPGVILNPDPKIHLKNLKPLPVASEKIDKCTECGFCESSCVSAGLTLTPRQRIAVFREISSLRRSHEEPHMAAALLNSYQYEGNATCATDGLCALDCPVEIDTGRLIKDLRLENSTGLQRRTANFLASNMKSVTSVVSNMLSVVHFIHRVLGTKIMGSIVSGLRKISFNTIPLWYASMPKGAKSIKFKEANGNEHSKKVVYFPSCINRTMGVSKDYNDEVQLTAKIKQLLEKAGYSIIYPGNLNNLCCGMAFSSKGYKDAGLKKSKQLENALRIASNNGDIPVLCDMSPCLFTMKENMEPGLKIYEPVEFILKYLIEHLEITQVDEVVSVFPVCSMKKMGLETKLVELAKLCSTKVIVPEANCCGFAGDRGFTYPELNRHGLRDLELQTPAEAKYGYSTSRTCEIGLTEHSGISYKSIVYLVDKVSRPKQILIK
jgi:D-lactate dehydrogenase